MISILIIIVTSAIIAYNGAKRKGIANGMTILNGIFIGFLLCALIVAPISAYITNEARCENLPIEMKVVKETTNELQEFQPNVYITTIMQRNYRSMDTHALCIKIKGETQRVRLYDSIIYCNAPEAKIVTRKYKFKSSIIKALLLDWGYTINELYTPEAMVCGEYDLDDIKPQEE